MTWYRACRRHEIPNDRGWPVTAEGRPIAVFNSGGRLFAVDNVCRHVGSPLDDGFVERGCVTCPWHGWRYDLSTGEHLTLFGRQPGLRTYPVRVEGDEVFVGVEP
ncbi:MAG: Rieske (2Fe-2S) protein [Acidimicrobiales bacterium]